MFHLHPLPASFTLMCAGGVFKLELFLPEDYPMAAPKVGYLSHVCGTQVAGASCASQLCSCT